MRTIKFRVWDKIANCWCYGDGIVQDKDIKDRIWLMFDKAEGVIIDDDNSIGQFTGLLDKNGKEIFEGDIMQHIDPFDIPFIVNWNDEQAAFVFNNDGCGFSLNDNSFYVIGNIFENPELINEKK